MTRGRNDGLVTLDLARTHLRVSLRANAMAVWRDAAEDAEALAVAYEELGEGISGPEALRSLAAVFSQLADHLDKA